LLKIQTLPLMTLITVIYTDQKSSMADLQILGVHTHPRRNPLFAQSNTERSYVLLGVESPSGAQLKCTAAGGLLFA